MKWIDTHAHLYVDEFKNDIDDVILSLQQNNIDKVLLPNIDAASAEALLLLTKKNSALFYPMMGLHPGSVQANYIEELKQIENHFFRQNFKSVGEIGLDYYWDTTYKKQQLDAFATQIRWAKEKKLPVAVHCRNAFDDVLEILEKEQDGSISGVLHCFTGNIDQAKRLLDIGFYLGIGGVVTYKNSGLDKTLLEIDLKHLVLETDAPYLSPVPYRGKRNETAYLIYVAQKLSDIYSCPLKKIADITTQNASNLFDL